MAEKQKQKNRGCTRKCGRKGRKEAAKAKPLSRYVRGLITANQYFSLTNQSLMG